LPQLHQGHSSSAIALDLLRSRSSVRLRRDLTVPAGRRQKAAIGPADRAGRPA
jgi:hypothetical protein